METATDTTSGLKWRVQVETTTRILYSYILTFEEVKLFRRSEEVQQSTEGIGIIPRIIIPLIFKKYDGPEKIKSICVKKINKVK